MAAQKECVVCRRECSRERYGDRDAHHVECDRCGTYVVTGSALMMLSRAVQASNWAAISAALRASSDAGVRPEIDTTSWGTRWLPSRLNVPVAQRMERLLRLVASRAGGLNDAVPVHLWNDCPLVAVKDADELIALLNHLAASGLLRHKQRSTDEITDVTLTVAGWNHLQQVPGQGEVIFVAMAFSEEMDAAFEAMRQAIEDDCGLVAHRVDKRHFTHEITEEIITGLHQCWAVVADVTQGRNGVYFEAGYGMALNRPVVFSVQEDRFDTDVHFDTQQYPHIVWKDEPDLRLKLAERLKGLLARAGRL